MKPLKELKGGSLSRTEVYKDANRLFVRKSISVIENREYGLVRWQSQIRKLQQLHYYFPNSVVAVERMGVFNNTYYYDIPYYEGALNCYQAVKSGVSIEKIARRILSLINDLASIKLGEVIGSLSVYISEEIEFPLKLAANSIMNGRLVLRKGINETVSESINEALKVTDKLKTRYRKYKIIETLTHGNLTLENLLWNADSESLMVIDPYSETYAETIAGDFSQLLQSTTSGYEEIVSYTEFNDFKEIDYPYTAIDQRIIELGGLLSINARQSDWYDENVVRILYASQFIRMYPFKIVNNPRQAILFLMHGVSLLKEAKYD